MIDTPAQAHGKGDATPWKGALAVAALSLAFHWLYFDEGIKNLVDLGVAAVDSERVLDGELFGRDFIAPYGPGRYYVIAAAFRIFSPCMTVLCAVFLVLRVLVDAGTFLVARRIMSLPAAAAAVMCVAAAHGPAHKGFLAAGAVLMMLGAIQAITRPTRGRVFLFGACVGFSAMFRYDLGIVGLVMALPMLLLAAESPAEGATPGTAGAGRIVSRACALLGGAALFFAPALFLILAGDMARLAACELSRAALLKHAAAFGPGPFESLFAWIDPAQAALSLVLMISCPITLVWLALARNKPSGEPGKKVRRLITFTAALSGFVLLSQYAIEAKINRLLQVGPPLFVCLFYLTHSLAKRFLPGKTRWAPACAMLALTGWYVAAESGGGSQDSIAVLKHERVRVETERGSFTTTPRIAKDMQTVAAWADRYMRDGTFYASSGVPLMYFVTGRKNPSPVTDFTYILRNEDMQQWVLKSIEENDAGFYLCKPAIIQGFDADKESPLLFSALRTRFSRFVELGGGYRMYMRE